MEYVSPPVPVPAESVRDLVALSVDDPLAPFALRPDKQHVLSADGRAAVGFRTRCGLVVVGGDPVGDPLSWSSAVDSLVEYARAQGRGIAVLGAGTIGLVMYLVVYGKLRNQSQIVEWVDWHDAIVGAGVIAAVGILITLIPTLVMTRKYLKV